MGAEIIALIAGLLALIPVVLSAFRSRKANRNEIGKVENEELLRGMDRIDAATARVQSPQLKN